jgi:phosphoribosyl 1,2-cyclic phosphodiesterase
MYLRFWGVRGSIPAPGPRHTRYGGNTACLEIRREGVPPLILDAGSGIRELGASLLSEPAPNSEYLIFLTHFHWDHIQGLPFFAPLYQPGQTITFYASPAAAVTSDLLGGQMREPYFPVQLPTAGATLAYRQLASGRFHIGDLAIQTFPLRHPGGSIGYRIDSPAGSIVYATDHEHGNPEIDANFVSVAAGADLLIHDAQYTPREYESRRGRGHSTWEGAVRIARQADVKQLMLFHHDPLHDDETIDEIVDAAREHFPNCGGAREGWGHQLGRQASPGSPES